MKIPMTDTTKIIRILALVEILLIPIYIFLSLSMEAQLPSHVQQYIQEEANSDAPIITTVLSMGYLILYPAALLALIFNKRWGKPLFIFTVIYSYLLLPFSSPQIEHSILAVAGTMGASIEGAMLALLLITTSSFNKNRQQDAADAAPLL